nr:hypothetical protein [Tanacetum cinerariifolium]
KEAIYKKKMEINEKMIEMFSLLKEYIKGKSLDKVLVGEEVSKPVTKYVNAIYLVRMEMTRIENVTRLSIKMS